MAFYPGNSFKDFFFRTTNQISGSVLSLLNFFKKITRNFQSDTCLAICSLEWRLTIAFISINLVNAIPVVLAWWAVALVNVDVTRCPGIPWRAAANMTIACVGASRSIQAGVWETAIVVFFALITTVPCRASTFEGKVFDRTCATIFAGRRFAFLK